MLPQNQEPHAQIRFSSSGKDLTPADLADLQQHLYACVHVGRLDRAAVIVQRITGMFNPTVPSVIDAHHRYLSGRLDQLIKDPSQVRLIEMQKWLELDIRTKGVPVDHAIIAIMLKAALAVLQGPRLYRTLRRYVRFAQHISNETYEHTLSSSLFTEKEINMITRTIPGDFGSSSEELSEEDITRIDEANRAVLGRDEARRAAPSEPVPELESVEQKGLGLESLKRSLGSLDPSFFDEANLAEDKTEHQARLERDVAEAALERWRTESEDFERIRGQGAIQQAPLGSQIHKWIEEMAPTLKEELKHAEDPNVEQTSKEDYDIVAAAPFLRMMAPEKVAAITVLQFFGAIMDPSLYKKFHSDRVEVVRLCERMGMTVFKEARIDKIQTHYLQSLSSLPSAERHKRLSRLLKGKKWSEKTLEAEHAKIAEKSSSMDLEPWQHNHGMIIKVGAVLLGLFLKNAKITTHLPEEASGPPVLKTQPVAKRIAEWYRGKRKGMVQIPMELLHTLKKEPIASLIAKHLPMVVEPKPWTDIREGGYLTTHVPVIRFTDFQTTQKAYVQLAHQRGDMKRVYAGLDVISKTPWRVNRPLFRIMAELWNSGEGAGKIVPATPNVEIPPRPDTDDKATIKRWQRLEWDIKNRVASNHSQRCYQNFQLEVARAFSNTTFYCPQNVDYRGRAYPIPPYFNHTGADHVRALFNFAEGKELGSEGLFWLKIQLANSFGYDKASLSDRTRFVDEHRADIMDSVENPLNGARWWLSASDPWQTLAACLELKAALDLPDPTKHVSHLPIQQDGSCNGLQHYAALGGDVAGAQQVNLSPGDKPADVYTAVMELVKEIIYKDAADGDARALKLDGQITRKMVKQPVMTYVYGVTYHGATHQVAKQLRALIPGLEQSLDPDTSLFKLSSYVASCIFKALNEMFTGAQAIQIWLGECGARISSAVTPEQIQRVHENRGGSIDTVAEARKLYPERLITGRHKRKLRVREDTSFKSTIVWTTPLGLPVVQPYRDYRTKVIKTHLQDIHINTPTTSDPVNKRKQLQGFPPNFIHSLDASHMMLSALKCDEIGLTFGSVHDSFWTHAADVPTLNKVLRDAFVSMHKEDIVKRLREEFEARYAGCYQWTSVKRHSPLGKKLEQYFKTDKNRRPQQLMKKTVTSGVEIDDLLEETMRGELLRSDDLSKQDMGKNMVTAASIVEEAGAGDDEIYTTDDWGAWHGKETHKTGLLKTGTAQAAAEANEAEGTAVPADLDAEDSLFDPEDDAEELESEAEEETAFLDEAPESVRKESKSKKQEAIASDQPVSQDDRFDTNIDAGAGENSGQHEAKGDQNSIDYAKAQREHRRLAQRIHFWKPLTFPEPPPKGAFDVTCLSESKYFFS